MNRISYRNWNDGDHIGVGYGRETCNPAASRGGRGEPHRTEVYRMKFYIDGKKVTKKVAMEKAGAERFGMMLKDAKQAHAEDPNEQISFMVPGGILTIEI